MEEIVSKKSYNAAILHFVTAAMMILSILLLLVGIFSGYFFEYTGPTENYEGIGHGFVAVFSLITMIGSMAAILVCIPLFFFSGAKLKKLAYGEIPAKKSYIATLVVKIIAFVVILVPFLFLFSLENGWAAIVIHILVLALILVSSIGEACARRNP